MTPMERRGTFSLAGIYGLRMMGLFLILPVFSLYAEGLEGVTPILMGLAIGAYGFTMAMLQIPFGWVSDRVGRKPVIATGLLIFAIGSVVAAMADSIWGVIFGRALQGAGAIAAAMMALLADLTREENRSKAMATVGMTIGMSFTLALILGPFLGHLIGVDGIFWMTAVLALFCIGVLYLLVPDPNAEDFHVHRDVEAQPNEFGRILRNVQLLRLDAGILILHAVMTSMFIALPFVLRDHLHIATNSHAWVYLPVLVVALFFMVPLIIAAEKKDKMKQVFLICITLIAMASALLGFFHETLAGVIAALFIFFVAYNVLEATLPSLISRMAPIDAKGTAMGVYSTSQFFGAFLGGAVGGWCYGMYDVQGVFYGAAALAALWLLIATGMKMPPMRSSMMAHIDASTDAASLQVKLLALQGVSEAKVVPEESAVFLRVDKKVFEPETFEMVLKPYQTESV